MAARGRGQREIQRVSIIGTGRGWEAIENVFEIRAAARPRIYCIIKFPSIIFPLARKVRRRFGCEEGRRNGGSPDKGRGLLARAVKNSCWSKKGCRACPGTDVRRRRRRHIWISRVYNNKLQYMRTAAVITRPCERPLQVENWSFQKRQLILNFKYQLGRQFLSYISDSCTLFTIISRVLENTFQFW